MDQALEWRIPSNQGWNEVAFRLIRHHRSDGLFEFAVTMTGLFWPRNELLMKPTQYGAPVDDFVVSLPSVMLSHKQCEELIGEFDRWLESYGAFDVTLTSEEVPGQLLWLEVEPEGKGILDKYHPALTIRYYTGRIDLEIGYFIDQSCIRIARDSLASLLD
ncbi:MAG: hypothetical protein ACKV0T_18285 [Planctomycetales bacterium]